MTQEIVNDDKQANEKKVEEYKDKLLNFFGKFADIAEKLVGKVLVFLILSFVSAGWISFYLLTRQQNTSFRTKWNEDPESREVPVITGFIIILK